MGLPETERPFYLHGVFQSTRPWVVEHVELFHAQNPGTST